MYKIKIIKEGNIKNAKKEIMDYNGSISSSIGICCAGSCKSGNKIVGI